MLNRLFGRSRGQAAPGQASRTPPGQHLTSKFPVLTYGAMPKIDLETWRFRAFGLVEEEVQWTWEEFVALPKTTVTADFHCVTQWSRLDNTWEGVLVRDVMQHIRPKPEARHVLVHCFGGYTTNLSLEVLSENNALFAHRHDGEALSPDHGGPMRLVVPHLYGWKSAKWVGGLEFLADEQPGFWEKRGYHNVGDPWKEQRFTWDP